MKTSRYIVIIDDSGEVYELTKKLFKDDKNFIFTHSGSNKKSLEAALNTMPDLIIINADDMKQDLMHLCEKLRRDSDNTITPIIVTGEERDPEFRVKVLSKVVEYYIPKPLVEEYFYYTIKNISRLIYMNRCVSPLTGLPGNVQIELELKRRIASKKMYAVIYFDLDNFKAYNDRYGYINGDNVIKFTSNLIQEAIQENGKKNDFLGHVGGDDFVAVLDYENAAKIAKEIVKRFDQGILEFYSEEDIEKEGIELPNRLGKIEKFPLMTITVSMVSNRYRTYTSTLDIGEEGAMIKKKAKTIPGSTFLEDKRKKV